jgi:hypothetical protein
MILPVDGAVDVLGHDALEIPFVKTAKNGVRTWVGRIERVRNAL